MALSVHFCCRGFRYFLVKNGIFLEAKWGRDLNFITFPQLLERVGNFEEGGKVHDSNRKNVRDAAFAALDTWRTDLSDPFW